MDKKQIDKYVQEGLNQQSLARKTLLVYPLGPGEIKLVRIFKGTAFFSSQYPKQVEKLRNVTQVFPSEFYTTAIATPDMKEKILNQHILQEERHWKHLVLKVTKPLLFKKFTYEIYQKLLQDLPGDNQIYIYRQQPHQIFLGSNVYHDLLQDRKLKGLFVPKTNGCEMGSLGDFKVLSKPILKNDIIVFSKPNFVGMVTLRKLVTSEPTNDGRLFSEQIIGMTISNPNALIRGHRV